MVGGASAFKICTFVSIPDKRNTQRPPALRLTVQLIRANVNLFLQIFLLPNLTGKFCWVFLETPSITLANDILSCNLSPKKKKHIVYQYTIMAKMAKIQNTNITKCWQEEQQGNLTDCHWECKWYSHFGRQFGSFLQTKHILTIMIQQSSSLIFTQMRWKSTTTGKKKVHEYL